MYLVIVPDTSYDLCICLSFGIPLSIYCEFLVFRDTWPFCRLFGCLSPSLDSKCSSIVHIKLMRFCDADMSPLTSIKSVELQTLTTWGYCMSRLGMNLKSKGKQTNYGSGSIHFRSRHWVDMVSSQMVFVWFKLARAVLCREFCFSCD